MTEVIEGPLQCVIESRDMSEMLLTAMARNQLLTAAMVCKVWAMLAGEITRRRRKKILDTLVVRDLEATATYGQGICFFHPPSTSALICAYICAGRAWHGAPTRRETGSHETRGCSRKDHYFSGGTIIQFEVLHGGTRRTGEWRCIRVWQESLQVCLPNGAWMTVETLDTAAYPTWMAASFLQAPGERWRSICGTPEGDPLAWDGPVLQGPPL